MSGLVFDEDIVRRLETVYRSRDVLRRRALIRKALGPRPGERIVDVGCGPGFYVAELSEAVGPEGGVVGVDSSPQSLAMAQQRCAEASNTSFLEGDATKLPVPDASFDAAVCVQVLEYVPDVAAALDEIHRALRPGGRVVVWDVDWSTVSLHAPDAALTERVLDVWDEHLVHRELPRTLAASLRAAGFEQVRAEGHTFATTELDPETYGGALVGFVANFVASRGREADAKAWKAEQRALHDRGEFFFACIQFGFTAIRP